MMQGRRAGLDMACRDGYALIAAIFIVFVLSALAIGLQTVTRERLRDTIHERYRQRADWAARAGVEQMLSELRRGVSPLEATAREGPLHHARLGAGVNPAPPDLMAALLPGQATPQVYLITATGTAFTGPGESSIARQSRLSLLVRVDAGRVVPLLWLPEPGR